METLTSASMTPSVCNSNLSQTSALQNNNNNNNLRDASFSSYLNGAKETFAVKLSKSSRSLNSLFLERTKEEDGEIDVFGAEKYFNGGVDDEEVPKVANNSANYQTEEDKPTNLCPVKPKVCPKTPSIHSESSWDSRSVLLQNIPRNNPSRKKHRGKSFLASIGCGCSCNDKNSVNVDEQIDENSPSRRGSNRVAANGKMIKKKPFKYGDSIQCSSLCEEKEMQCKKFNGMELELSTKDHFTFPVLDSEMGNPAVEMRLQEEEEEEEDEDDDDTMRKSLEVFGSPIIEKGKKHSSLNRRLEMLSWDAFPRRVEETEVPSSSSEMYNDIESDASSDLFEIESFSNNAHTFLTRQVSDGKCSSLTPTTTCYAPSEASIEWSVVTASAADFLVMSDTEELTSRMNSNRVVSNANTKPGKDMYTRHPSIFLGCKSHKAVKVAGDAYRSNQKAIPDIRRHHKWESFRLGPRSHTERKLMAFEFRKGQHSSEIPSLPRLHPPQDSHLLYMFSQ